MAIDDLYGSTLVSMLMQDGYALCGRCNNKVAALTMTEIPYQCLYRFTAQCHGASESFEVTEFTLVECSKYSIQPFVFFSQKVIDGY